MKVIVTLVASLLLLAHLPLRVRAQQNALITGVAVRQEEPGVCDAHESDTDLILSWFFATDWPFENAESIVFEDPNGGSGNRKERKLKKCPSPGYCAVNYDLCILMGCGGGRRRLGEQDRELLEAPVMELNAWHGCDKGGCEFPAFDNWKDLSIAGMKKGKPKVSKQCDLKRVWVDIWV